MSVKLDGIFASEARDSSGERVSLKGMDISSLTQGVVNFEHKKDIPSQICGKIIFAKKIFEEKDCESERELYYWHKIQLPYLYGIVELFDGHDGANAIIAMLRYEQKNPIQDGKKGLINWSIDGVTLNKDSSGNITDCIARDLAFSNKACNKTCVGEELPQVSIASPLDAIKSLFKNENNEGEMLSDLDTKIIHLEALLKTDDISEFAKTKITEHLAKIKQPNTPGGQQSIGGTPRANLKDGGKILGSGPKQERYVGPKAVPAPRPKTALPNPMGVTTPALSAPKVISGDEFKAKIQAFKEKAAKQNLEVKQAYAGPKPMAPAVPKVKMTNPMSSKPAMEVIKKAEVAGSMMEAPGSSSGFSALAGKDLKKQADDMYAKWDKKEDFEQFLSSKLPKLSKNEIKALAKMYSVAMTQKKEDLLKNI